MPIDTLIQHAIDTKKDVGVFTLAYPIPRALALPCDRISNSSQPTPEDIIYKSGYVPRFITRKRFVKTFCNKKREHGIYNTPNADA